MTISKDLLLSILSLDAYNRGYHSGINGLSTASGTQIGMVTISDDKGDLDAQAAGFYAISYTLNAAVGDMAAGETIISYRGTRRSVRGG